MDTVNHIKLRVERTQSPALLRALLTAIFFHRRLDNTDPETLDMLETHVASLGDRDVEREIAAKVDEWTATFVDSGAEGGEIAVVFLQRKNRKGWFAVTEALVPWEEHLITLTFVKRATTNPLPGALLQILSFCAEMKGNVPPLVGTSNQNNLSHQILLAPPPPDELFAPASPGSASPPPRPATAGIATPALDPALAVPRAAPRPMTVAGHTRAASPMAAAGTAMGYLGQAKDGLLAGAKAAGAGVGWGGRAVNAAFGGRG